MRLISPAKAGSLQQVAQQSIQTAFIHLLTAEEEYLNYIFFIFNYLSLNYQQ